MAIIKKSEATATVAQNTPKEVKPVAYGRELSSYEILKDKRIGVAGIAQAVIGSPVYAQFLMTAKDANEADKMLTERVEYWVGKVKEISERA